MPLLLAGPSSLDALRQTRCDNSFHQLNPVSAKGQRKAPEPWEIDRAKRILSNRTAEVFVDVSSGSNRPPRDGVRYTVDAKPKPKGTVIPLDAIVSMASPELLFLQMHQHLSDLECIALGMELCGSYAHQGSESFAYGIPPCTSKSRLQTFLGRINTRPNIARAKRNLAFIHDNSCSLRETQLALLLTLPPRWGGYGFSNPILNRPFDVISNTTTRQSERRWADISWPNVPLAVEYDSNEFHSGSEKITRDASRRTLLQAAGIEVVVVTNTQLKSVTEMDRIARAVARAMGKRQRYYQTEFERKKRELHRAVLGLAL